MVTPRVSESDERKIVALISAVQFVNVLDFVMVMPMGPDFAAALAIPTSKLGWIGGSYTAAATFSGLAGSFFLDRFDRKKALFVAMIGLVLGTFAGGFATGLGSLMVTRWIAGIFGGPATSLALSVVADTVPPERRGRAMGTVMGSFSMASIFGIPLGLELARIGGWRAPFFAVASFALLVSLGAVFLLPPLRGHLGPRRSHASGRALFRAEVVAAYASVGLAMLGAFMIVPNISTYLQINLGLPRERLASLYFFGGIISYVCMKIAGHYVDRVSAHSVAWVALAILAIGIGFGYVPNPPLIPISAIFLLFMVAMSVRGVASSSVASRVPLSHERARFMSFQSAVQHFSSASGSFLSTALLTTGPGGILVGMDILGIACLCLAAPVPLLLRFLERRAEKQDTHWGALE